MTQIGDFGFKTVVTNNLPNGTVTGYAEAYCPGESFPYVPPSGWVVQSCTVVGVGVDGCCSYCGCSEITCAPVTGATTTSTGSTTSVIATPAQPPSCTISGNVASYYCNGVDYYTCTTGVWTLAQSKSTQCGYVAPTSNATTTITAPGSPDSHGCNPTVSPSAATEWCSSLNQCVSVLAFTSTCPSTTNTAVCAENATTCSGTTLYVCSNGGWVQVESNSPTCGYVAPTGTGGTTTPTTPSNTTFGIDNTTLMYIGIGAVAVIGLVALMGGRKRGGGSTPTVVYAAPPASPPASK